MGKTIEVRLSDAQHAQLVAEAEASGQTFFGYCRSKLTLDASNRQASVPHPRIVTDKDEYRNRRAQGENVYLGGPSEQSPDDRISRIEAAVAALTDHILQGQALPEPVTRAQSAEPFDVDSLVNAQFAEAEANGLTEHVPDVVEEVMNAAGVRPLSRRPIRYSPNTAPRHLQTL